MAFQAEMLPLLAFDALSLALAGALVALNPGNRATRVFALFLTLRGGGLMAFTLALVEDSAAAADLWLRLWPYGLLPLAPVTLYFIAVYPEPRRWLPRGWKGALPFLGAAALLDALYLLDHSLFWGAAPATASPPWGHGWLAFNAAGLVFSLAALRFGLDWLHAPPSPARRSLLLVSMGFALVVVFDGAASLANAPVLAGPFNALQAAVRLGPVAALAALLAARGLRAPLADDARLVRRFLLVLLAPALSGAALALLPDGPGQEPVALLLYGLWRLPMPILVAWALVRHRLFGVAWNVPPGVRQAGAIGLFLGIVFIVSEGTQTYFAANWGPILGAIVGGLAVFALAPLEGIAQRAAHKVEAPKDLKTMTHEERIAHYRARVQEAWSDGHLDRGDAKVLRMLSERLGLSAEETLRVESEISRG